MQSVFGVVLPYTCSFCTTFLLCIHLLGVCVRVECKKKVSNSSSPPLASIMTRPLRAEHIGIQVQVHCTLQCNNASRDSAETRQPWPESPPTCNCKRSHWQPATESCLSHLLGDRWPRRGTTCRPMWMQWHNGMFLQLRNDLLISFPQGHRHVVREHPATLVISDAGVM